MMPARSPITGTRLLVRGFDKHTKERHLRSLFAKYGPVTNVKIRQSSWRNKYGYSGAVEMLNDWKAEIAIVNLNGAYWRGRTIWVRPENRRGD